MAIETGLTGRVAFITGAAHGQGRATALALAAQGCDIVGFDLGKPMAYPGYKTGDHAALDQLGHEIEAIGRRFVPALGDVRQLSDLEQAVDRAKAAFSRIDILFNNAGICAYGTTEEMEESHWDAMIDINLKGAFLATRAVVPVMKAQKSGVIINNSSIGGLRGMGRLPHYAASKWGLTGLTKSWAIEFAPFGIRVISIHPTGVNTPMNDGLAELEGKTPQEIAEASAGNLLPIPWIEPDDVAEAVVYLASDKARYVTGSQFVLDAGLLTK